ncbi:MAG: hypothetical protein JW717_00975 [Marinilabiliaceae bacterium]|nr:hypothetical protein [Marinilabiliaceae bacterium]
MKGNRTLRGVVFVALAIVMMSTLFVKKGNVNEILSKSNDEILQTSVVELANLSIEDLMKISDRFSY